MRRDLKSNIVPIQAITPALKAADVTGATIDLKDFDSADFVINPGILTDGVFTPKLEESDNGSVWTDVAAEDQDGTFAVLATDVMQEIGYRGYKQYARVFITVTGSPATGCVLGAQCIKGHGIAKP